MRLFLATPSTLSGQGDFLEKICVQYKPYILESFYYVTPFVTRLIPKFGDFLLDSGAFTFMHNNKNIDYKIYTQNFIDYINKNNIKHYFELDIDSLIGFEEVKKLRAYIEKETNKKCIPVFHKSRGLKEWEKMCEEYNYVAIGTIGEYAKNPEILKYLLSIARKNNTKVHGLGFTQLKTLKNYDFYSVDSTSWNCGNRFGTIYRFNGHNLDKVNKPTGKRVLTNLTLQNNFLEWVKYQLYVDKNYNYRGYCV